jgi:hypothetical protein
VPAKALITVAIASTAALGAAWLLGHDDSTPRVRAVHRTVTLEAGALPKPSKNVTPPASNFTVLSEAKSRQLLRYARDVRDCLHARGVSVGAVTATRLQIEIAAQRGSSTMRALLRCTGKIGDPPHWSSLQVETARLVLYLPRQCLLDTKAIRAA